MCKKTTLPGCICNKAVLSSSLYLTRTGPKKFDIIQIWSLHNKIIYYIGNNNKPAFLFGCLQ